MNISEKPKDLNTIPSDQTMAKFSKQELLELLGGKEWSCGLYLNAESRPTVLPSSTFYLLDVAYNPFLPKKCGEHGASLITFFNEDDMKLPEHVEPYAKVPLFICDSRKGNSEGEMYTYYGLYSQHRWSDRLDHDTMSAHVPQSVRLRHAETLTALDRPQWMKNAMINHFYPKPVYSGCLPRRVAVGSVVNGGDEDDDNGESDSVAADIMSYVHELQEWSGDARLKVSLMQASAVNSAYDKVRPSIVRATYCADIPFLPPGRLRRPSRPAHAVGVPALRRVRRRLLRHAGAGPAAPGGPRSTSVRRVLSDERTSKREELICLRVKISQGAGADRGCTGKEMG